MKIKKGDTVVVITGKDKGKVSKVVKTFEKDNKVVVENVNLRSKFKKRSTGGPGEVIKFEARMDASNVMAIDQKTKKRTRIGYKTLDTGKKVRVAKKSNEVIE